MDDQHFPIETAPKDGSAFLASYILEGWTGPWIECRMEERGPVSLRGGSYAAATIWKPLTASNPI